MALAVAFASDQTQALPLQEIIEQTRGSVAHLSIRDSRGKERGSGSGFLVSSDGKLATNFHVIAGAERVVAVFAGGKEVTIAGIWTYDKANDVVLLQLAPGSYKSIHLSKEPAKTGEEIAVIGSPLGLGEAVSTGVVSAVREKGVKHDAAWTLQISAATAPGSSGSPILNARGQVVGLAVGAYRGEAVYFGIPAERLQTLLDRKAGELTPLGELNTGRSVRTNLLISLGGLAGFSILVWLCILIGKRWSARSSARAKAAR